jgi:ABC-2 type transport system ATP-binding protein
MRITADAVSVGSGPAAELPPTSVEFGPDAPAVLALETDRRPTVLSLVVSGRMKPTAGTVLLEGRPDAALLRARVALVDTPIVAEPAADLPVGTVVREELALAGLPASRAADLLRLVGAAEYAKAPLRLLPGALRTRLLAETAAARPGVLALVLTSPERHGGDPAELAAIVNGLAERGFAVLTLTTPATQELLTRDLRS